jgi:hypothetical protein
MIPNPTDKETRRLTLWWLAPLFVLAALAAGEIGLRLVAPDARWSRSPVVEADFDPLDVAAFAVEASDDELCRFLAKNAAGCPDITARPAAGVTRLICVGSSSTMGLVEAGFSYPGFLAEMLNDNPAGKRVEVVNFGIPATALYEEQLLYRRLFSGVRADALLVMSGPSFRPDLHRLREREARPPMRLHRLLWPLAIYRFGWSLAPTDRVDVTEQYARYEGGLVPDEIYWKEYHADLETMRQLAWSAGAKLLLLQSIEVEYIDKLRAAGIDPGDRETALHLQLDREAVRFAAERNATFVTLYEPFLALPPNTPGLWLNASHPGRLGTKLVADKVAAALAELGVL